MSSKFIPVARPKLPAVDVVLPHLKRIDQNQYYSNFGPLNRELESILEVHFNAPTGSVVCCANATLGLTAALLLNRINPGGACLVPAWTFAASVHAIIAAGLEPFLVDCDLNSGQMTPEIARNALESFDEQVTAVMPVSVFGAPIDYEAWSRFQSETGVTVVSDSAAAFDTVTPGKICSVVSLHATKLISSGEGGFILCPDKITADEIRARINFGFSGRRVAEHRALNGKMSDYSAAIGLASMDERLTIISEYRKVAQYYNELLPRLPGVSLQKGFGTEWISTTINLIIHFSKYTDVSNTLAKFNIDTRSWWEKPIYEHRAFKRLKLSSYPNAKHLAGHFLGLPFYRDMKKEDVYLVVESLRKAVKIN